MIETLRDSYAMQTAIFGALFVADILLAIIVALFLELRKERENAEIRKALTHFPPEMAGTPETDDERAVREAKEDADAFRLLQNYSVANAYGAGDGG